MNSVNDGTVNTDVSQTEFNIMGGMDDLLQVYQDACDRYSAAK